MGKKSRPFKLQFTNQQLVRSQNKGQIKRDELISIVERAATGLPDTAKEEVRLFASTTDKVGFGYWAGQTVETGENCGCPMASISDWVEASQYHDHPATPVQGWGFPSRFDSAMLHKTGADIGWVHVVD